MKNDSLNKIKIKAGILAVFVMLLLIGTAYAELTLEDNRITYDDSPLVKVEYNETTGILSIVGETIIINALNFSDGSYNNWSTMITNGGDRAWFANGSNIQVAIDDLGVNGGTVIVPAGDYTIDNTINLTGKSSISLKGAGGGMYGTGSTRFYAGASLSGSIISVNPTDVIEYSYGHNIENIVLDGLNYSVTGLLINGAGFGTYQNLNIENCRVCGLNWSGGGNNLFEQITIRNCDHGINLSRSAIRSVDPFESSFKSCRVQASSHYAVYAVFPDATACGIKTSFVGCVFESGDQFGVRFYNAIYSVFDHCVFEANNGNSDANTDDLEIKTYTQRTNPTTIKDCIFIGTDTSYAIDLFGSNNIQIINTLLSGSVLKMSYCNNVDFSTFYSQAGQTTFSSEVENAFFHASTFNDITIGGTCKYLTFDSCDFGTNPTDSGIHTHYTNCNRGYDRIFPVANATTQPPISGFAWLNITGSRIEVHEGAGIWKHITLS